MVVQAKTHHNRINALPSVVGTTLSVAFASLKAAELKPARYAGCYEIKQRMKKIYFVIFMFFSTQCMAIGWETITKENISASGISLSFENMSYHGCQRVDVKLPEKFDFKELGKRKFSNVSLQKINKKDRGWQLTGKGSNIRLPTKKEGNHHEIPFLCLSNGDIKASNLAVSYETPRSSPPIIVIINLVDFI